MQLRSFEPASISAVIIYGGTVLRPGPHSDYPHRVIITFPDEGVLSQGYTTISVKTAGEVKVYVPENEKVPISQGRES